VLLLTCRRIISEGSEEEVRAALQGLERDVSGLLGGLPLYEPLFQLMCHGVQSSVKAAVFRCVSAGGWCLIALHERQSGWLAVVVWPESCASCHDSC
jgi:hypothetical protein